jgi:hypothetical protein
MGNGKVIQFLLQQLCDLVVNHAHRNHLLNSLTIILYRYVCSGSSRSMMGISRLKNLRHSLCLAYVFLWPTKDVIASAYNVRVEVCVELRCLTILFLFF